MHIIHATGCSDPQPVSFIAMCVRYAMHFWHSIKFQSDPEQLNHFSNKKAQPRYRPCHRYRYRQCHCRRLYRPTPSFQWTQAIYVWTKVSRRRLRR